MTNLESIFRTRTGPARETEPGREDVARNLAPLVRRALRDGSGPRQLVDWVRRHLPEMEAGPGREDPDDLEPFVLPLARRLGTTLLPRLPGWWGREAPAYETVSGV